MSIEEQLVKLCPICQAEYQDAVEYCSKDGAALVSRDEITQRTADPLIGAVLGEKLRVERLVARGGMGRIYEARHVRLGRRLAVKVLSEQFTQNEQAVLRFQREAQTAASLESPHIVDIIDIDKTPGGHFYIVMEFLEGEELRQTIDRERVLPFDRAARIFKQLAQALDAAHARGIVHRDLKPENIFLCRRGDDEVAKIVDFGISKIRSGEGKLTQTGAVIGTPYYMAPEQAKGDTRLDHRADIYALGAILYELFTGRRPAEGDSPTGILMKILLEEPTPPRMVNPTIPEPVEAVIVKAMSKEPEERYSTAGELAAALAVAAGVSQDLSGVPPTAPHPVQPSPLAATGLAGSGPGLGAPGSGQAPVAPGSNPALAVPGSGPVPVQPTTAPGYVSPPSGVGAPPQPLGTMPAATGVSGVGAAPAADGSGPVSTATPFATTPGPVETQAPRRRPMGLVVGVVVAAALFLVVGGVVGGLYLARGNGETGSADGPSPVPQPHAAALAPPAAPDAAPSARNEPRDTGSTSRSVQVMFTSDPEGAEVVRDGEVLCSPTPCEASFPPSTGPLSVTLRVEGRPELALRFETGEGNMTVTGQLAPPREEPRRGSNRRRGSKTGRRPGDQHASQPTEQPSGPTSPGLVSSPFSSSRTKSPSHVANPFD